MRRSRLLLFGILFQIALVFAISSCGGSSSGSSKHKPTRTPTATPTATPAFQAQAPINGTVAIQGAIGAAPGAGTVKATVLLGASAGSKSRSRTKKPAAQASCSATGSGPAYPDGSFAVSVCASVGDNLGLTYTSSSGTQTSLGTTNVPETTQLPTCPTGFRTFQVINTGSQTIWLGVNSGAQPAPASASFCGTTPVGSACSVPGTICSPLSNPAQCYYVPTNIGETQGCSSTNTNCSTTGQTCNTSMGLCQWNLAYDYANTCSAQSPSCPANETCDIPLGVCLSSPANTIPASDLTLTQAQTQVLCVPAEPSAPGLAPGLPCTTNSQCSSQQCNNYPAGAPVQQCNGAPSCVCGPINPFSGGLYARTGCQPDGTNCSAGDCLSAPYQPCPVGKGAGNPSTQAEFTLSEFSQDFYDVTVINGANAAIAMAPTAVPTAAAPTTDTPAEADYWCATPGGPSAQGPLPACSWSFDTTVSGASQTSLLAQISLQSCSQPIPTPTPSPAPTSGAPPSQAGCPIGSTCVANGAANYYCKPQLAACTSSSQCPGGMPCVNGFCNPYSTCSTASDCLGSQACVNGLCNGIGCTSDSNCSFASTGLESATCISEPINGGGNANVCVPLTCDTSVSCPTGFTCSSTTGAGTCQPTNTACSLTSPCPSIRQACNIPAGQISGTCETAAQCGPDGSCPNNSVCGPNNLCVPGGVACAPGNLCPGGSTCPGTGFCPGACTSDSDCADVAGTCSGGKCLPLTADGSTSCPSTPSSYQQLTDNTCVLSCTGSSSCTNSNVGTFCGSGEFNANVITTCGVSTGSVWSMDDFCGITGMGSFAGINCGNQATGQPSPDTYANLFGCNGNAQGSAVSCYNNPNNLTTCCGCPTNSSSLEAPWSNTVATLSCSETNTTWTGTIQPWLVYLKTACPTAYSFPFDDATSTFQCQSLGTQPPPSPTAGATPTGVPNTMNYAVSFGPITLPGVPTPTATSTP